MKKILKSVVVFGWEYKNVNVVVDKDNKFVSGYISGVGKIDKTSPTAAVINKILNP